MHGYLSQHLHKKNSANVAIGGVGMLLNPHTIKLQNSIERIRLRMMYAIFNGNFCITIISCYSPTYVSYEKDITTFYNELSSLVSHNPKHNVLIINEDMNAHMGKDGNKFYLCNWPNRNGKYLAVFSLENKLSCLNTKLKQGGETMALHLLK